MKVALCLFKYFPFGGLQRDFFHVAQELISRGHSVRVYVQSWQGDEDQTQFELIIVPTSALSNHKKNEQYCTWVTQHLKESPVDMVVGFNRMPGLDVYYAADVCYQEKNRNRSFLYKLTPRFNHFVNYEKLIFDPGQSTKILVLNQKQKEEYQGIYHTEDERFTLLPPGISQNRKYSGFTTEMRYQFRKNLNLDPSDFCLLQIGSDFSRKGVDRSIRALASLPDEYRNRCFLFVVGQDSPEKFISLANELRIEKQVHFMGGRKDIPSFICAADLFLHPARSESAGIAILEALVGGLPEIVTDVCGYAPYVKQANSGIVLSTPYSQNEMNDCLLYSLDQSKLESWKKSACLFADTQDLYSLPKYVADFIEKEYASRKRTL